MVLFILKPQKASKTRVLHVPPTKRRRLVRAADKHGVGSSSAPTLTSPFKKFFEDVVAVEKSMAVVAIEALKHKAPKIKVPLYYDDKIFQFLLLTALSSD